MAPPKLWAGKDGALAERPRRRDVAVAALYGERLRGRVRAYGSSRGYVEGMSAQAAWLEEADAVWADGFRAMKLRIGRDDPAAEIAAIEGLVGEAPAMTWMADGNGAWGFDDSLRVGRALDGLGFRWFEEPMPTNDYAA